MAEKKVDKKKNVVEKMIEAKARFSKANIKKTGLNPHSEFEFYQLQDIVPTAIDIFTEIGLLSNFSIENEQARLTIINSDDKADNIIYSAPFEVQDSIVSKTGKAVTNKVQNIGASITYYRRYLWMMALDVIEKEEIDQNAGLEPCTVTKKIPVSTEERSDLKKELTGAMDSAPEHMILTLKKLCKKHIQVAPAYIKEMLEATNNLQTITKKECEQYIINLSEFDKAEDVE